MTRTREVFAVYHFDRGWLIDTCAGGAFTGFDTLDEGQAQAKTWATPQDVSRELDACELELGVIWKHFEIVPIAV